MGVNLRMREQSRVSNLESRSQGSSSLLPGSLFSHPHAEEPSVFQGKFNYFSSEEDQVGRKDLAAVGAE